MADGQLATAQHMQVAMPLAGIEVVQPAQLTRVVQPGAQPKTLQDA